MSHTPEPWKIEPCKCGGDGCHSWLIAEPIMTDSRMQKADAARIVSCVNGCQGLNPAAYKQVVEALTAIVARINGEFDNPALDKYGMLEVDSLEGLKRIAQQALARAEGRT